MDKYLYKIPIRNFIIPIKGNKPPILQSKPFKDSVPYLDIDALENDNVTQYSHKDVADVASEDDILVVWDGSRSGLVFKGRVGAIGSTIMCLKPIGLTRDYLFYFLRSQFDYINGNTSGAGIPHVSPDFFYNLEIPYMPIEDQKQMVFALGQKLQQTSSLWIQQSSIVEQLLIETKVSFQYDTKDIIKSVNAFRQTILQKAVSGQLTEQWRLTNKISLEKDWILKKIKELGQTTLGKKLDKDKNQGQNTRYLRNTNVRWYNFDLSVISQLKATETDREKYSLQKGDVLICEGGHEPGRSAVWEKEEPDLIFQMALHRVRLDTSIFPIWLVYNLKADSDSGKLNSLVSGIGIKHFTQEKLKEYEILLPPLHEQEEILRKVNILFAIADRVQLQYELATNDLIKLEKAILYQAYNKEIFTNDLQELSLDDLLSQLEKDRTTIEKALKNAKKLQFKKKAMTKKARENNPILTILENAPGNTLTIEEIWQQSMHYEFWESDGYERFYKEIEANKSKLIESRSSDGLIITLILKTNENQSS